MKLVIGDVDFFQFFVLDFESFWVRAFVHFATDSEPFFGPSVSYQIDDHFMTDEGSCAPILGYERKESVFDLVPFAGSRWKVTHRYFQAGLIG